MTEHNQMATVQVAVREATIQALLELRISKDESLAGVIARLAEHQDCRKGNRAHDMTASVPLFEQRTHKYEIGFLDQVIGANSLGKLYGKLVDALYDIAPEAVENLAVMRSRSRRYVAKDEADVHPNSPHLQSLRTNSGYFVSKNVGTADFIRGMKALCSAADLTFDRDVWFRKKRRDDCTE